MKRPRFTESQVVAILKEGEAAVAVAHLARNYGISAATYYHWKSEYAGAGVPELKRVRELEAENAKLKRVHRVYCRMKLKLSRRARRRLPRRERQPMWVEPAMNTVWALDFMRDTFIRCDNGPELTSEAFTAWCREQDIELRFIQPGQPGKREIVRGVLGSLLGKRR
jgi:putative transposase